MCIVTVSLYRTGAVTRLSTELLYIHKGRELVSGSYDKTVRIFRAEEGRSREVYHTKRMQRLTNVLWSNDNRVSLVGSKQGMSPPR